VRGASSDAVDHEEIGRHWLDRADRILPSLRPGVAPTATPPLDLTFAELVADPIRTADRICDFIGVPLTAQARMRMTAFLAAQPHGAGTHRYHPEQFGLTQRKLETRFADYMTEFRL
jgi:LPS sulfotransferase NodH